MITNSFRFPVLRSNGREISRSFRHRRGESGSELVEFALVMMGLFLVLFGVMGFAHALYAYHFVSHAAREGARFAIVRGSACSKSTFATACPANPTDVQDYVASISPGGIDTTNLTVDTKWPGNGPGTCATYNSPGCPVRVQVHYNFHFIFPLLSSSSVTMTSASQMVISQ